MLFEREAAKKVNDTINNIVPNIVTIKGSLLSEGVTLKEGA